MKLRHALRGTAAGLLLAVCLTTPTLALTGVVDVGGSVLRVRKTASTGSAVLDQLPSGKQVEIVDTATNGWYGIRLGSVKGYVSASYIKLLEEAAPVVTAEVSAVSASAAQSESTYVKVTADALNVRTGPGTDYAVADELAQGKVVKVLGTQAAATSTRRTPRPPPPRRRSSSFTSASRRVRSTSAPAPAPATPRSAPSPRAAA